MLYFPERDNQRRIPTEKKGHTKYGPQGLYSQASFDRLELPDELRQPLVDTANHAICRSTWSSYKTSAKMLDKCLTEHGEVLTLPISQRQTTLFIAWLLKRNLSTSTIQTYISGIKTLHLVQGVTPPTIRTPFLHHVLVGKQNQEMIKKREGVHRTRLPMTQASMKLLKKELLTSNLNNFDRSCYWATATIALAGGFRISELLCPAPHTFDPNFSLLHKDIKLITSESPRCIQITLRREKTNKTHLSTVVDIFESKSDICPYRAISKYFTLNTDSQENLPAFRLSTGANFTSRMLNAFIKDKLNPHVRVNGYLSGHSFRSGLCSILGSAGFNDDELKSAGRWSSSAFEFYSKLPRMQRRKLAKNISNIL